MDKSKLREYKLRIQEKDLAIEQLKEGNMELADRLKQLNEKMYELMVKSR